MLTRWGIRLGCSLAGIAAGLLLATAIVSDFSITATALIEATLIFWLVHFIVQVMALRVLIRQPSIALAGLLALVATIVSLVIVNAIVSGLSIHGAKTYVPAALIIWLTTAIGDTVGARMIKARRRD
ncbi:MAG TPA: hypothetical protein VF380_05595 [Solirubrobacteraceae bacterium]